MPLPPSVIFSAISPSVLEPLRRINLQPLPMLIREDSSSESKQPIKQLPTTIIQHFADLQDPRRPSLNIQHNFQDILVIAICAVICGADSYASMEVFGQTKKPWFEQFLELRNGIPSHDTFNDVFRALDTEKFEECFIAWTGSLVKKIPGVVPIDGKTLRRSHDKKNDKKAIHIVSAWSVENSLVLGQIKTEEKSNEITAIPELLKMIDVSGCLVTIDAMGCQTKIASTVRDRNADYLLAVKDNQPNLLTAIIKSFSDQNREEYLNHFHDYYEVKEKHHGRVEIRRCWVSSAMDLIPMQGNWQDLKSIIFLESERTRNGETSLERRCYISSANNSAAKNLEATRSHWHIENKLHWVLDVAFREDECRIRKGNGAENFSTLRKIALNLLRREKSRKVGIKIKQMSSGWDENYLLKVLSGLIDFTE